MSRALGAVVVVIVAALAGVYAVAALAPERLRREVEELLADATGAPVSLGSLRLVVGFPLHLEARGLDLWNGALRLEYGAAQLAPLSLLVGQPRLSRLDVQGASLTLTRVAPNRWEPDLDPDGPQSQDPTDEPLLAPLQVLERTAREMLERPTIADIVTVARSRITYLDGEGGPELARVVALRGELVHRARRGDAELHVEAEVSIRGGEPARVEAEGIRSREDALDLSVAVTTLDLRTLEIGGRTPLRGTLSGTLDYDAQAPGRGDIALDLVVETLAVRGGRRPFETPRFAARVRAGLGARQLDVREASVSAGSLGVALTATLERPIDERAHMGLTLGVDDVDIDRARALIGWLPEEARGRSEEALAHVEAGTFTRVEARGGAGLDEWDRLLAGEAREMPWGMRLVGELEGVTLALDDGDRLESLSGRVVWSADRVEADLHQGSFNGSPLPKLDAEIHGVSHLFAADPSRRALVSGAPPLPGLEPLWETLWGDEESGPSQTPIRLELDYMHHPALLWPVEHLHARFEPSDQATRVAIEQVEWAGIPLDGFLHADAVGDRIELRLFAEAPAEFVGPRWPRELLHRPTEAGRIWAMGRFEVGRIDDEDWRQESARGSFQAAGDEVDLTDVNVALLPQGSLQGAGWIELGLLDRALFRLEASLVGGDAETLLRVAGAGGSVRGGSLDLEASLEGALAPQLPLLSRLAGRVSAEASDGVILESVPALVALALATDTLSAFGGHEEIRYDTAKSVLSFSEGRMSTEALDIDGPDLRLFVAGSLDLLREPHAIDAELALFLFRQIDSALVNIPIVSSLLLGTNESLVAAYFSLEGPWEDPVVSPLPLRTLAESPAGSVFTGIPDVMSRGLRALGGILGGSPPPDREPPRADGRRRS